MILFYILAIVLIASAVFTVTQKSPVYSVVGLLLNFLTLATLYFTLNAEFIGIIQIVVYSGAILMLFVFVIALLSSGIGPFSEGPNKLPRIVGPTVLAAIVGFGFIAYGLVHAGATPPLPAAGVSGVRPALGEVGQAGVFGSVADFGAALFTTHLLPFEATAFVLMVAVIGVVLIASDAVPQSTLGTHKRPPKPEREPILKATK